MKKRIFVTIFILIILGCISTLFINLYMINKEKKRIIDISEVSNLNDIDAIVILGCKAYSNGPSLMLSNRLLKGLEVYNILNSKILLSGDHGTKSYDEVNVMRDYMLNSNIKSEDIFLDHAGFNTYDSMYRLKYVFEAKKVIIVTQEYHMYRALYIADSLGIDAYGVVASDIPQKDIMLKNNIREILSRDWNFIKVVFQFKSKYLGEVIPLDGDGNITLG